ncbi:MAG TPA: hypothetical protein VHO92_09130, partial [Methanobacterium sp.]|nr:hypothetical protein [Methanobacterium sp.]
MISNIVLTAKAYITDPPATASSNSDFFDPNSDNDNADATVDVGAGNNSVVQPSTNKTNNHSKTIPLQKTGIPIAGMLLAALMVFAGARPRMK